MRMRILYNCFQVLVGVGDSGRTTVAEVPYMEGFICKRKSYVDTGRV